MVYDLPLLCGLDALVVEDLDCVAVGMIYVANAIGSFELNTIDKILCGLVAFLIAFIITIIILFCIFQNIPDTLVECVFSLAGSEAIITAIIWYIKKRYSREAKNGKTKES